ncbi:MAG: hypothetical protein SVS15_01440 [Thermodesulfobacteriota bacterium]|nr:hypothetical protein [Thermodesulfobacteriota bacterium]
MGIDLAVLNGCAGVSCGPELETSRREQVLALESLRCVYKNAVFNRKPAANDPLFAVLYQKFRDTCQKLMVGLPQREAPLHAEKARDMFQRGCPKEALKHLKCALKILPGDESMFADLVETAGNNGAAGLIDSRKFRYQGSFGEAFLSKPVSLLSGEGRDILVCEPTKDIVSVFDSDFRHKGKLPLAFKRPFGVFSGERGLVWICDYGNQRLVAVDSESRSAGEISLKDFAPKGFKHISPGCACMGNGTFYILATASDPHDVKILSFNEDDPAGTFNILNSAGLFRPFSIAWHQEKLVVGTFVPSALYVYDFENDRFENHGVPLVPGELRGLSTLGGDLWTSCTDYICKISSQGGLRFVVDVSKLTGRDGTTAWGLCALERDGETELIAADKRLGCLHRFSM